jgi:hypothetical protein
MLAAGIWQVIMGLLTIFAYGPFVSRSIGGAESLTEAEANAVNSFFGSINTLTISFGMIFILPGIANIFLSRRWVLDATTQKRIPIFLIVLGVASYFLMDFIGGTLMLIAGVLMSAKNKAISRQFDSNDDLIGGVF